MSLSMYPTANINTSTILSSSNTIITKSDNKLPQNNTLHTQTVIINDNLEYKGSMDYLKRSFYSKPIFAALILESLDNHSSIDNKNDIIYNNISYKIVLGNDKIILSRNMTIVKPPSLDLVQSSGESTTITLSMTNSTESKNNLHFRFANSKTCDKWYVTLRRALMDVIFNYAVSTRDTNGDVNLSVLEQGLTRLIPLAEGTEGTHMHVSRIKSIIKLKRRINDLAIKLSSVPSMGLCPDVSTLKQCNLLHEAQYVVNATQADVVLCRDSTVVKLWTILGIDDLDSYCIYEDGNDSTNSPLDDISLHSTEGITSNTNINNNSKYTINNCNNHNNKVLKQSSLKQSNNNNINDNSNNNTDISHDSMGENIQNSDIKNTHKLINSEISGNNNDDINMRDENTHPNQHRFLFNTTDTSLITIPSKEVSSSVDRWSNKLSRKMSTSSKCNSVSSTSNKGKTMANTSLSKPTPLLLRAIPLSTQTKSIVNAMISRSGNISEGTTSETERNDSSNSTSDSLSQHMNAIWNGSVSALECDSGDALNCTPSTSHVGSGHSKVHNALSKLHMLPVSISKVHNTKTHTSHHKTMHSVFGESNLEWSDKPSTIYGSDSNIVSPCIDDSDLSTNPSPRKHARRDHAMRPQMKRFKKGDWDVATEVAKGNSNDDITYNKDVDCVLGSILSNNQMQHSEEIVLSSQDDGENNGKSNDNIIVTEQCSNNCHVTTADTNNNNISVSKDNTIVSSMYVNDNTLIDIDLNESTDNNTNIISNDVLDCNNNSDNHKVQCDQVTSMVVVDGDIQHNNDMQIVHNECDKTIITSNIYTNDAVDDVAMSVCSSDIGNGNTTLSDNNNGSSNDIIGKMCMDTSHCQIYNNNMDINSHHSDITSDYISTSVITGQITKHNTHIESPKWNVKRIIVICVMFVVVLFMSFYSTVYVNKSIPVSNTIYHQDSDLYHDLSEVVSCNNANNINNDIVGEDSMIDDVYMKETIHNRKNNYINHFGYAIRMQNSNKRRRLSDSDSHDYDLV
jgi:hypothetical protein